MQEKKEIISCHPKIVEVVRLVLRHAPTIHRCNTDTAGQEPSPCQLVSPDDDKSCSGENKKITIMRVNDNSRVVALPNDNWNPPSVPGNDNMKMIGKTSNANCSNCSKIKGRLLHQGSQKSRGQDSENHPVGSQNAVLQRNRKHKKTTMPIIIITVNVTDGAAYTHTHPRHLLIRNKQQPPTINKSKMIKQHYRVHNLQGCVISKGGRRQIFG